MQTLIWEDREQSPHLCCNSYPRSNPIAQNNKVRYIHLALLFVPSTLVLLNHTPCQSQEQNLGFMGNASLLPRSGWGIADKILSFWFIFPSSQNGSTGELLFYFLVVYYRKEPLNSELCWTVNSPG